MSTPLIPPVSVLNSPVAPASSANSRGHERAPDTAQQFEALLIGQMLVSVRQSGSGWLGSEDSSGEFATDYAEQQFAAVLARNGGLGVADLITKGLEK
jgi:Rod binding domain-containing protein